MKLCKWVAPVAVVVALFLAPVARGQVLQQVPTDALVVIKFNKIKATSDKVAAMSQKFGLAGINPELADPIGTMRQKAKLTAGVDDAGDAAFVIMPPPPGPQGPKGPPTVLFLLPVTDYTAFLGNFPDAKAEGDVSTVTVGGKPHFAANWGKYAVLSDKKDLLAAKPALGLTPPALSAKELDSKDICAFANGKTLRDLVLPKLQQGRAKIIQQFEQGATKQAKLDPKYVPVLKVSLNRVLDVVEQAFTDVEGLSEGVTINDSGLAFTGLAEFAANSPSAQHVAMLKPTDQPLLAGLPPDAKFLFFGGSAFGSGGVAQLISEFTAPIEKELANLGDEGKLLQNYVTSLKTTFTAGKSGSWGMIAPGGMLGQESIFQFVAVVNGDAKALLEAQKQQLEAQQAIMSMVSPGTGQPQMKIAYTANAKTIDGVELNQFQTSMSMPPGAKPTPQQMQAQQMMTMMYGPGGMNGYSGAVAPDKAIITTGMNDAVLASVIKSAKANDRTVSQNPTLVATAQQLPKQRLLVAFIQLDQIANTVVTYAKQFGMPVNLQLPQSLPPIGVALTTEGGALRGDAYVPAQTIQSLIAAGMQSYMQMQRGAAPGGPAGL